MKKLIILLFIATLFNCTKKNDETVVDQITYPRLEDVSTFGSVFYNLQGSKGVVLCFHGTGGSAEGWTTGTKRDLLNYLSGQGYQIVCPTSVDRGTKQWNNINTAGNLDSTNVDAILTTLGIPLSSKIFLIGHSNGGGFTSRMAVFSARAANIKAIQVSNAAGIAAIQSAGSYTFPTLFAYADCDPIVAAADVRSSISIVSGKSLPAIDLDLDAVYAGGPYADCHEFVATTVETTAFFDTY